MENPIVQQSEHTLGSEQGQFKQLANTIYQVTEENDYETQQNQKEYAKPKKSDADLVETYAERSQASRQPSRKESKSQVEIVEKVLDPEEVHKGLRELHARVDEVLRRTPNGKKEMYHSIAGTSLLDIERRGPHYLDALGRYRTVDYNNPFVGADIQVRTYEPNIATPVKNERIEEKRNVELPNYLKYSLSVTKHDRTPATFSSTIQPSNVNDPNRFDKGKLDDIISRILSRQGGNVESQKVVYEESGHHFDTRHEAQKQAEPEKYYCGELENDDDSLIMGYLNEKAESQKTKDHTYYCGGLEDDE